MVVHLFLQIILYLFWPIKASELANCPSFCGNITILYPFGIGEGCYFDYRFNVTCDDYFDSKPFLSSSKLELSEDVSYSSYTVGFNLPAVSSNGRNTSTTIGSDATNIVRANLSGIPFCISNTHNRFAVIGCDKYEMINQIRYSNNTKGTCVSMCTCNPTQKGGCYDFLCTIPPEFMFDSGNISIPRGCNSSFIVDQDWLEQNYLIDPHVLREKDHVPASLKWGQRKGKCVELYSSHAADNIICTEKDGCSIKLSSEYLCLFPRGDILSSKQGCIGDLICITTSDNSCSKCPYNYNVLESDESQCYSKTTINDVFIKESRVKLYVTIGCSSGFGVLVLVIGVWWLYRFIRRRKAIKLKQKFFKRNGGLLLQQHWSSNEGIIEKIKLYTSDELEKASDNYNANRILGQGGQGTVYKGMSGEGRIVAIKKSKKVDAGKIEEFINEVVILSQINHRNVVQLLGCCLETEVPLLVYEFIPNGTLFQYMHDLNEEFPFTWELRLRIAAEVADALSYLHSAASVPIYHRDIKSSNILLDEKYRAKVSDFGTSRSIAVDQTHLTIQVQGTFGYLDPEYFRSSQFTEKSDVYSFGVVLAELLTGQKPILPSNHEEDRSLVAYFLHAMEENSLFEIVDTRVLKEGDTEDIITVANLTRRCLNLNGKKRPTMKEVATELSRIRVSYEASNMQQNCDQEIDSMHDDKVTQSESGSSTDYFTFGIDSSTF